MISVNGVSFSLDRKEKGADIDFISHAHSDHIAAAKSSSRIYASGITKDLLCAVSSMVPQSDVGMPKSTKLINAGHILGSRQIVADDEVNGSRIVYTGDFQMQKSRSCEGIEIEEADVAIVDSTYYQPSLVFGERQEVEDAIQYWAEQKLNDGIVLFGTYALGKAQELISILNEKGVLPLVSRKISTINRVYRNNGVKLDYASAYEGNDEYLSLLRGNFVCIVENGLLGAMAAALAELCNRRVHTAVATGFAKIMKFNTEVQFPLSDHADFKQCTEYIDAAGVKKVLTYGQNRLELASALADRGYDAMPFETKARRGGAVAVLPTSHPL